MCNYPVLHAMWGIIYRDSASHTGNLLMYPSPDDSYIKWRPFSSIPFVVNAYNIPGAPRLFSSKEEAASYIQTEGLDAFQNAPHPIPIYITKEERL